jgi:hypothetical protein
MMTLGFIGPMSHDWKIWVAAFLTLCILSFLYRDNPFYRLAEHLLVGLSTGYFFLVLYFQVFKPNVVERLGTSYGEDWVDFGMTILIAILGLLMLSRLPVPFLRPYGWLSRWPMALVVGFASGVAIPTTIEADIMRQVMGAVGVSIIPGSNPFASTGAFFLMAGNIVLVLGTISALVYFFFSMPHRGVVGGGAKIGIWVLMLGFGASFGYTVMARLSLFIGRVLFLLQNWLGVID